MNKLRLGTTLKIILKRTKLRNSWLLVSKINIFNNSPEASDA